MISGIIIYCVFSMFTTAGFAGSLKDTEKDMPYVILFGVCLMGPVVLPAIIGRALYQIIHK